MACGSNHMGGRKQEPTWPRNAAKATQERPMPRLSAGGISVLQVGEDVKKQEKA